MDSGASEILTTGSSATDSTGYESDSHVIIPRFVVKLRTLLNDPQYQSSISWNSEGTTVQVSVSKFRAEILGKVFTSSKYKSFVRQMNLHGFKQVLNLRKQDKQLFQCRYFVRDDPHGQKERHMKRRVKKSQKPKRTEGVALLPAFWPPQELSGVFPGGQFPLQGPPFSYYGFKPWNQMMVPQMTHTVSGATVPQVGARLVESANNPLGALGHSNPIGFPYSHIQQ